MVELLKTQWVFSTLLAVVLFGAILTVVAYATLAERKIAAWVQDRRGPNRVGFFGLFRFHFWGLGQPVADGLKFFLKEDIVPAKVDKPLFIAAPAIALIVAMLGFAIIPWGGWVDLDGDGQADVIAQVASLDIGLLYLLGVGAMGVYGAVLGGWASNNKYSLYGAMRATAQMISYEIPMGLSILVVVILCGQVRLEEIVSAQVGAGQCWYVAKFPLAFLILLVTSYAETNRMPFDLAESEQEIVAGYHTEYSSMKFSLFFMGEYTHMIVSSAFISALFLGGYHLPFVPWTSPEAVGIGAMIVKIIVLFAKIVFLLWLFMLVRWTVPRFRFDQLMRLAWKKLIPMGVGLVAVAVIVVYWRGAGMGLAKELALCLGGNGAVLLAAVGASILAQARGERITGRQANLPGIAK
jgi:NADH-quinone oxidoreductase subunit H